MVDSRKGCSYFLSRSLFSAFSPLPRRFIAMISTRLYSRHRLLSYGSCHCVQSLTTRRFSSCDSRNWKTILAMSRYIFSPNSFQLADERGKICLTTRRPPLYYHRCRYHCTSLRQPWTLRRPLNCTVNVIPCFAHFVRRLHRYGSSPNRPLGGTQQSIQRLRPEQGSLRYCRTSHGSGQRISHRRRCCLPGY